MSLNFSVERIKNKDELCFIKLEDNTLDHAPLTQALAWYSMIVKFHTINEANAGAVYKRIAMYERMFEPLRRDGEGKWIYTTLREVRSHIGFHSNGGTWETPAAFKRRLLTQKWEEVERAQRACEATEK